MPCIERTPLHAQRDTLGGWSRSFKDEETRRVFQTGKSRRLVSVASAAARRLGAIDFARELLMTCGIRLATGSKG